MSAIPEENDVGYCTPEDVVVYFRAFDKFPKQEEIDNYDPGTGPGTAQNPSGVRPPSYEEVENLILRKSSQIDRETGHAWRERRVVDEMRDIDGPYYWNSGVPVPLLHREVFDIDPDKGDKLEVWTGERYEDWAADDGYTHGRDGDYWVHSNAGILYIYRRPLYINRLNLRVSYRYGKDGVDADGNARVPKDIEEACAKLVAAELIRTDIYGTTVPGGDNGVDQNRTAEAFEEQAQRIIEKRKEVRNPL